MLSPGEYNHLNAQDAIALQRELSTQIRIEPLKKSVRIIGGADISFNRNETRVFAGIVLLSYPDLEVIDKITVISETHFPYIPGLLAFREIPPLMEAWEKLSLKPDVMIMDGHGIAHQRRTGLATHFGILANIPAIGCAKSRLRGKHEEVENTLHASSPLMDRGERVGTALKTKLNCKPIYVSPGHLITLEQSEEIITQCIGKYRIPEPTRLAHLLVNEFRRQNSGKS